jgi:hypothetical protein
VSAPSTPARDFAAIVNALMRALATERIIGRLAGGFAALIGVRLATARAAFAELAERIAAGRFRPRRYAPRRPPANPIARPPGAVPQKFGWLVALMPLETAMACRGHLELLLHMPDTVALIQAAPAATGRLLRPLCWALRLKPPPVLARPRRPKNGHQQTPPPAPDKAPATPPRATRPPAAPAPAPRRSRPRRASPAAAPPHPA